MWVAVYRWKDVTFGDTTTNRIENKWRHAKRDVNSQTGLADLVSKLLGAENRLAASCTAKLLAYENVHKQQLKVRTPHKCDSYYI